MATGTRKVHGDDSHSISNAVLPIGRDRNRPPGAHFSYILPVFENRLAFRQKYAKMINNSLIISGGV